MSATRTQIYLTQEQRDRVDALVRADGTSLAEVIRRALDAYLEERDPSSEQSLTSTFGSLPDLLVPGRDEWVRG